MPEHAVMKHTANLPAKETFTEMLGWAKSYINSGLAPYQFDTPEKLVVGMQYCQELGLQYLTGLSHIKVINGKPTLDGDGSLICLHQKDLLDFFDKKYTGPIPTTPIEKWPDDFGAIVIMRRCGYENKLETKFTVSQAKRAGLWAKPQRCKKCWGTGKLKDGKKCFSCDGKGERHDVPWLQYPERMLYYRALGFGVRDLFPDGLAGLVTAEEVQDYPESAFERTEKPQYAKSHKAQTYEQERATGDALVDDLIGKMEAKEAQFTDVPPANVNPETGEITDETQMPDAQGQDNEAKATEGADAGMDAGSGTVVHPDPQETSAMTPEEKLLATIREIEEAHPTLAAQMRNSKTQIGKIVKEVSKGRARTSLGDFELQVIVAELNKAIKAAE